MASRSKGITVEIGGDTTKLSKALEGVNKNIKNTLTQLKDVQKLLKLDPCNTELLSKRKSTREGCLILLLVFIWKLDDLVYGLLAVIVSLDCHIQGSGVISCNICRNAKLIYLCHGCNAELSIISFLSFSHASESA